MKGKYKSSYRLFITLVSKSHDPSSNPKIPPYRTLIDPFKAPYRTLTNPLKDPLTPYRTLIDRFKDPL